MIELAPSHKRGLALENPVMNAAGTLGFADEYRGLIDFSKLGAFVTNPFTLKPRTPAKGERVEEYSHGVLLHTGLPNPGMKNGIRQHARKWGQMPCPVIVHVAATTPAEVAGCVEMLERVDEVDGVELGLRDDISGMEAESLAAAAVQSGSLPVLVRVPLDAALPLAKSAARAGAQAVTVAAPPRGTQYSPREDREWAWVTGRLYSPAVHPLTLKAVRDVASAQLGLPVVGAGGIHSWADARATLAAGAAAIQLDSVNWVEPRLMETLAQSPMIRDWGE